MPKGQLLGQGRTAEIFAWENDQVLKLMRNPGASGSADQEARVAQIIDAAGLSAPAFAGQIVVDGRPGLLYERVNGPTLLQVVAQRPWRLLWAAQQQAILHAQMHNVSRPGLRSMRGHLQWCIDYVPQLTPSIKERALRRLRSLPDGNAICHGDFHPDNVIVSERGPVVLDWMTASSGPPAADVARTTLLFLGSGLPPAIPAAQIPVIKLIRRLYYQLYLRAYRRLRPMPGLLIQAWLPIMAAARLAESIAEEEAQWLAVVDSAFGT